MSRFADILSSGRFVVTTELNPPKGTDLAPLMERAEMLRGVAHAFNLTDSASSRMTMAPMAVAHHLLARGIEPILQLTCRDRNRIALQSDLLSAHALGITNVVCMTGAAFFQTQAVYDPDRFEKFMNSVKGYGVPVLAGLIMLKSGNMARNLNANLPGFFVPDDIIRELDRAEDRAEKSVEISTRIIRDIKHMCSGVHIMAIGWESRIPQVLEAAGVETAYDV